MAALSIAGCGGGGDSGGGVEPPPPGSVTISGRISYDRVPYSAAPEGGLDFSGVRDSPAREVVVELLRADGSVAATGLTDGDGRYSLAAPPSTDLMLRAKAQSRFDGSSTRPATWNLRVLDNTNGDALYVLDGSLASSGTGAQSRSLRASSGWGVNSYTGTRAAAPFAVLDTLYQSLQVALSADSKQTLRQLDAFWSTRNRSSNDFKPELGQIKTTSYRSLLDDPENGGIYVQGLDGVDTDEYDAHVLAHEFFHYLEDFASRSDTTGGDHALGEKLDARLAFSEGFANAWSAIVIGDPVYRDSFGPRQGSSFYFNLEDESPAIFGRVAGWFDEVSVQSIVYDLIDSSNDGVDSVALGIAPVYRVLQNELRTAAALTTVFPLLAGLESQSGAPVAGIRALVQRQNFGFGAELDQWATGEANSGGNLDALPMYLPLTLNGPEVQACTGPRDGVISRLGNRRFLRFSLEQSRRVEIAAIATGAGTPLPDPDMRLYRRGFLADADAVTPFVERYSADLPAGTYVLEVFEWTHADPDENATRRPRTCMNVSITG